MLLANSGSGARAVYAVALSRKRVTPIGTLIVKGKDHGIASFEPLNGDGRAARCASSYRRAFDRLTSGDPQAVQAFAAHVGRYRGDALASFHLKRLLAGETGARIAMRDAAG